MTLEAVDARLQAGPWPADVGGLSEPRSRFRWESRCWPPIWLWYFYPSDPSRHALIFACSARGTPPEWVAPWQQDKNGQHWMTGNRETIRRLALFVASAIGGVLVLGPVSDVAAQSVSGGPPRSGWYVGGGIGPNWASGMDQEGWNRETTWSHRRPSTRRSRSSCSASPGRSARPERLSMSERPPPTSCTICGASMLLSATLIQPVARSGGLRHPAPSHIPFNV